MTFISESNRVLKDDGILALAIPTATDNSSLSNLGILKFTWSSEHYSEKHILEKISQNGFEIVDSNRILEKMFILLWLNITLTIVMNYEKKFSHVILNM